MSADAADILLLDLLRREERERTADNVRLVAQAFEIGRMWAAVELQQKTLDEQEKPK